LRGRGGAGQGHPATAGHPSALRAP
jgi:hypothetical protein